MKDTTVVLYICGAFYRSIAGEHGQNIDLSTHRGLFHFKVINDKDPHCLSCNTQSAIPLLRDERKSRETKALLEAVGL